MRSSDDRVRLGPWGWDAQWESEFQARGGGTSEPARVLSVDRGSCLLITTAGEVRAPAAGRLREAPPAAGDWVVLDGGAIQAILPRRSRFVRQSSGAATRRQVVAANVDTVFLMTDVTADFNLRRMERYLVVAFESGARPVILLGKSDLTADPGAPLREMEAVAQGVAVHAISPLTATGLEQLDPYMGPARTVALLGSSGVGKSTLINVLAGRSLLATGSVREGDGRGRHTTTRRLLVRLPGGALVIDTPGLRELLPWDALEGMHQTFDDLEILAQECRFSDCRHQGEPGCAVAAALESGELDSSRLENYRKLRREQQFQARRRDEQLERAHRREERRLHRHYRKIMVDKRRR